MANLVCLVVHDPGKVSSVVRRWLEAGVGGLTMLDTTGLARYIHGEGVSDDVPLFPSMRRMLAGNETHSRMLLSVVADDLDLDSLVRATEEELGPLERVNSGILFVVPVTRVVGLRRGISPSGET